MKMINTNSLVLGDIVEWTEAVFSGSWRRPTYVGDRSVRGRIVSESYGSTGQHTFTIEVHTSEGEDPIDPGKKIRRKGRNLYKNVKRGLWGNENDRRGVLAEKRQRSAIAKRIRKGI